MTTAAAEARETHYFIRVRFFVIFQLMDKQLDVNVNGPHVHELLIRLLIAQVLAKCNFLQWRV